MKYDLFVTILYGYTVASLFYQRRVTNSFIHCALTVLSTSLGLALGARAALRQTGARWSLEIPRNEMLIDSGGFSVLSLIGGMVAGALFCHLLQVQRHRD